MKHNLIAPCGMNCALCIGYQREKNKCSGCRDRTKIKTGYQRRCIIIHCDIRSEKNLKYCSDICEKYPCKRLQNLDKRYRNKYGMGMIENLEYIKEYGIRAFIKNEQEQWKCPECGEILTVHRDHCIHCGAISSDGKGKK